MVKVSIENCTLRRDERTIGLNLFIVTTQCRLRRGIGPMAVLGAAPSVGLPRIVLKKIKKKKWPESGLMGTQLVHNVCTSFHWDGTLICTTRISFLPPSEVIWPLRQHYYVPWIIIWFEWYRSIVLNQFPYSCITETYTHAQTHTFPFVW